MAQIRYDASVEKYEHVWSDVLQAARRHAAAEGNLARAVRMTEAGRRPMGAAPTEGSAFGKPVTLPGSVMMAGRLALKSQALIEHCPPGAGLVAELGSGWGLNLFDLWLSGGPRVPYLAMEPTETGRAAAEVLATLDPALDLATRRFDFHAPDYAGLHADSALVFSSHSIEQVPELAREAITGLFDIAPVLTGVHFEPVGWQTGARSELGATRAYAERSGYNLNLWPLLRSMEAEGLIDIRHVVPDILGHKTRNATTLIVWTRR